MFYRIGFAYVPTLMAWYDALNMRGARLQAKVVECAKLRRIQQQQQFKPEIAEETKEQLGKTETAEETKGQFVKIDSKPAEQKELRPKISEQKLEEKAEEN